MMERAMQQHIFRLQEVLMEAPDTLYALYGELPATGYDSYEAILDDIQSRMFEDFPKVSGLAYDIFDLDEEIASTSGITAYFNIPTLDGEAVRQLRVNPLTNDVSSIATYSTVAHEGFPGHMYQYAYLYENVSSPWRKALADCPAYTGAMPLTPSMQPSPIWTVWTARCCRRTGKMKCSPTALSSLPTSAYTMTAGHWKK